MAHQIQIQPEQPYDVHGHRGVLDERIERDPAQDAEALQEPLQAAAQEPAEEPPKAAWRGISLKQAAKIAAGVALVAVFGWLPLQGILQRSSVEAVINSRIVTLRAPIDGRVTTAQRLSHEGPLSQGEIILLVSNPRAERTHLDDLRRQLARYENDRPSLEVKLMGSRAQQRELAAHAERYKDGRIKQLEVRMSELKSIIEVAVARKEEASAAVERSTSLVRSGSASTVDLARLTRERTVMDQTVLGARDRLSASEIELAFAREGTFVGDSYNDRPSSIQREEEMRQRIDILKADLATADAETVWLQNEINLAQSRYNNMTDAQVISPIDGRVWEIMTSPGEDVRAGQPLLRVLDCSSAVVTANVTESVYNGLYVGAKASFRPASGGPDLEGTVANLTGSAGAAANLAISPDVLSKEPYRVTVSVPQLSQKGQDCAIGRTGRVIFSDAQAGAP